MTSKENIISFPDNLNITLSGIDTMRLHEHGQAIFVHLSFDEKLSSIQSSFLIKQILKKGMLDFQLTDFMFNRAKGFHGPFKSKLLKNSDFKQIDEQDFFESIYRVISKERTDTPLITEERKNTFIEKIELMTKNEADFYILSKELSNEPMKFEHEWSHALTEYHEFLILNYSSNNIFCLLLAYD